MKKPKVKEAPEPKTKVAANNQLRSVVERIERLEEKKKEISDDIREVFAEAKGNGYDIPAMKAVIRLRRMDPDKRAEFEEIVDIYKNALGMLSGTVFEDAARENVTH